MFNLEKESITQKMQRLEDQTPRNGEPPPLNPYAKNRLQRTVGGIIVSLGGASAAIIALLREQHMYVIVYFVVALIGAGIMHPSVLSAWFKNGD